MKYKLNFTKFKKYILATFVTGIVIIGGLVLFAFSRTWGKTEIQFKIHINEKLVQQSTFGESPTFAIWIEEPVTKKTQTVSVLDSEDCNLIKPLEGITTATGIFDEIEISVQKPKPYIIVKNR